MLKAKAYTKEGKPMMILGLSRKNIEKMQEGLPIHFKGSAMGIDEIDSVTILYGETERDMYEEFKKAGIDVKHQTIDMKAMRKDQ